MVPPGKQYLTTDEAAAFVGCHTRTLMRWRLDGTGPAYRRAGKKRVLYSFADLQAWLDRNRFVSTSADPFVNKAA